MNNLSSFALHAQYVNLPTQVFSLFSLFNRHRLWPVLICCVSVVEKITTPEILALSSHTVGLPFRIFGQEAMLEKKIPFLSDVVRMGSFLCLCLWPFFFINKECLRA